MSVDLVIKMKNKDFSYKPHEANRHKMIIGRQQSESGVGGSILLFGCLIVLELLCKTLAATYQEVLTAIGGQGQQPRFLRTLLPFKRGMFLHFRSCKEPLPAASRRLLR